MDSLRARRRSNKSPNNHAPVSKKVTELEGYSNISNLNEYQKGATGELSPIRKNREAESDISHPKRRRSFKK